MSEQRFVLDKLYYTIMTPIEKISVGRSYMTYGEVVGCLNEQQADLNYLARFIGEFKVEEFRLKLRNLRMLENKIDEQQSIINKQERRIMVLENLLTNMGVKWVDDDE